MFGQQTAQPNERIDVILHKKKLLTPSCPSAILVQRRESHGTDPREISNVYFMVQIGQNDETLHEKLCTLKWLFFWQ
jgi:hypothetical protein